MKARHQPAPRLPRESSRWGWGGDAVRLHWEWTRAAGLWGQPVLRRWTVCFRVSPSRADSADALSRGFVGAGGRRRRPLSLQERF